MSSCEYCWVESQRRGIEYREMLRIAESQGSPCCEPQNGEALTLSDNARRLRAGQFWDADEKRDTREHRSPSVPDRDDEYGRRKVAAEINAAGNPNDVFVCEGKCGQRLTRAEIRLALHTNGVGCPNCGSVRVRFVAPSRNAVAGSVLSSGTPEP